MAKSKTRFVCQSCGAQSPRWAGKCPECEAWNSLLEEVIVEAPAATLKARKDGLPLSSASPVYSHRLQDIKAHEEPRISSTYEELDRVLGGGIVPGALILLGGEPGIGKSTLLLQAAFALAQQGRKVIYVTGEESAQQVKMRAARMGMVESDNFYLLAETDINRVAEHLLAEQPVLAIIDSIQSIYNPEQDSLPGSVSQVKHATNLLMRIGKDNNITLLLIGHVNKEGNLAGPRVLEHMVDVVLYFEGERYRTYRLIRSVKNRYGATNEVGVFEMGDQGLIEVTNPSAHFLSEYNSEASGSAIISTLEGTRSILVEVQALTYTTQAANPRRSANGYEHNRLTQILAVLEKRVGLSLSHADVFVNVVGGLRIEEPAADLGIAMAIVSSMRDIPIEMSTIVIGEVGLGGEVRSAIQLESRLKEASKLGFKRAIVPKRNLPLKEKISGMEIIGVSKILEGIVHLSKANKSKD